MLDDVYSNFRNIPAAVAVCVRARASCEQPARQRHRGVEAQVEFESNF